MVRYIQVRIEAEIGVVITHLKSQEGSALRPVCPEQSLPQKSLPQKSLPQKSLPQKSLPGRKLTGDEAGMFRAW
jgi:hypothetical protein